MTSAAETSAELRPLLAAVVQLERNGVVDGKQSPDFILLSTRN